MDAWRFNMQKAIETRFTKQAVRCPTLRQMAAYINAKFPQYEATVSASATDTSRKVSGQRYVHHHSQRTGNKLEVRDRATRALVFSHDSSQTYRHNTEVAEWILKQA
jgi:hypothetical protein